MQITGSTYFEIDFQTVFNLERNWKYTVYIGVKNFANL